MKGFKGNIQELVNNNTFFRQVIYTAHNSQLVIMTLQPREEIGMEAHAKSDQFFRFENGRGEATIDGMKYQVGPGDVVVVPAGAQHNIKNIGALPLKFYTIYSPPNHRDKVIHMTKVEAEKDDEVFDGGTSE